MRKLNSLILIVLLLPLGASAGKADKIVAAAKNDCNKEVTRLGATKLIKRVYLTCNPGTKVDIGDCQIDCMKKRRGAVVGGN